jgi:hypothetical protein
MVAAKIRTSKTESHMRSLEREGLIRADAVLSHVLVSYVLDRVGSVHELNRRTGINRQTIRKWGDRVPKRYLAAVTAAITPDPPVTKTEVTRMKKAKISATQEG